MKLGADNPKKVIITAALTVFALVLFIYMVFSGSGPGTASASATQPGTATPAAESHQAAHDAAVSGRVNSSLDPSLRTDRLLASEGDVYSGTGRNIFKAKPDPPPDHPHDGTIAQMCGARHGKPCCNPVGSGERPPPPPI